MTVLFPPLSPTLLVRFWDGEVPGRRDGQTPGETCYDRKGPSDHHQGAAAAGADLHLALQEQPLAAALR